MTDPSDPVPDGVPSAHISTVAEGYNYGLAGTYTQLSDQEFAVGDTIALTATVNDGYNFEGWYIEYSWNNETLLSKELECEYTVIDQDLTIRAVYSYYTVTTESNYYTNVMDYVGTYTDLHEQKVSVGDTVSLSATVNDGYAFVGWFIDGFCISEELECEYTMKDSNVTIHAEFRKLELGE